MALGKRKRKQQDTFWVTADKLGNGPRNAFYDRLNQLLAEIDFDGKLEKAAEPLYQKTARKGLGFIHFAMEASVNRLTSFWMTPQFHPEVRSPQFACDMRVACAINLGWLNEQISTRC